MKTNCSKEAQPKICRVAKKKALANKKIKGYTKNIS